MQQQEYIIYWQYIYIYIYIDIVVAAVRVVVIVLIVVCTDAFGLFCGLSMTRTSLH